MTLKSLSLLSSSPPMSASIMSMIVFSIQEILQRSVSVEDQRQVALSSRAQSKTTLTELLDTLKLLEEEPERLSEPKSYSKDKYAWIDEVSLRSIIRRLLLNRLFV